MIISFDPCCWSSLTSDAIVFSLMATTFFLMIISSFPVIFEKTWFNEWWWFNFSPISLPGHCLMSRVFANGLGDQGSTPGRVIPKTQKMLLGAALLNTQHYKVQIKCKWSNPGKGVVPSPTPWCCSSIEKGAFGSCSTKVANFPFFTYNITKRQSKMIICHNLTFFKLR